MESPFSPTGRRSVQAYPSFHGMDASEDTPRSSKRARVSPKAKSEKSNESQGDGTEAQEDWVGGFLIVAKESSPSQEMVIASELRTEVGTPESLTSKASVTVLDYADEVPLTTWKEWSHLLNQLGQREVQLLKLGAAELAIMRASAELHSRKEVDVKRYHWCDQRDMYYFWWKKQPSFCTLEEDISGRQALLLEIDSARAKLVEVVQETGWKQRSQVLEAYKQMHNLRCEFQQLLKRQIRTKEQMSTLLWLATNVGSAWAVCAIMHTDMEKSGHHVNPDLLDSTLKGPWEFHARHLQFPQEDDPNNTAASAYLGFEASTRLCIKSTDCKPVYRLLAGDPMADLRAERLEAEKQAEVERQAEAKRQAEARQETEAKQEAEAAEQAKARKKAEEAAALKQFVLQNVPPENSTMVQLLTKVLKKFPSTEWDRVTKCLVSQPASSVANKWRHWEQNSLNIPSEKDLCKHCPCYQSWYDEDDLPITTSSLARCYSKGPEHPLIVVESDCSEGKLNGQTALYLDYEPLRAFKARYLSLHVSPEVFVQKTAYGFIWQTPFEGEGFNANFKYNKLVCGDPFSCNVTWRATSDSSCCCYVALRGIVDEEMAQTWEQDTAAIFRKGCNKVMLFESIRHKFSRCHTLAIASDVRIHYMCQGYMVTHDVEGACCGLGQGKLTIKHNFCDLSTPELMCKHLKEFKQTLTVYGTGCSRTAKVSYFDVPELTRVLAIPEKEREKPFDPHDYHIVEIYRPFVKPTFFEHWPLPDRKTVQSLKFTWLQYRGRILPNTNQQPDPDFLGEASFLDSAKNRVMVGFPSSNQGSNTNSNAFTLQFMETFAIKGKFIASNMQVAPKVVGVDNLPFTG